MQFSYIAYDKTGAKFSGEIHAENKALAVQELSSQGLSPSKIEATKQSDSLLGGLFSSGVKAADIEFLTSELSLLLRSGVRIDKGIDIIRRTKSNAAVSGLLQKVSASLNKGDSLSDALSQFKDVFGELYINLVKLGEASGDLAEVFEGLAKDLKFRRELKQKIVQSLTYPSVILFICVASILFVFNFVVPQLSSVFADKDNLPFYTVALLSFSDWLTSYQMHLLSALAISGGLIYYYRGSPQLNDWWQSFQLKVPLLKDVVLASERIKFNAGLSLMLKAGLQIDRALELAIGSLRNKRIQQEMEIARNKVKRGSSLSETFRQTSIFPGFYVSLLEVGEESGNLSEVFEEISSRSRRDFENWTTKVTTLLEPLLIVFMGLIVGGVVVVMLLSMVSVNDVNF